MQKCFKYERAGVLNFLKSMVRKNAKSFFMKIAGEKTSLFLRVTQV